MGRREFSKRGIKFQPINNVQRSNTTGYELRWVDVSKSVIKISSRIRKDLKGFEKKEIRFDSIRVKYVIKIFMKFNAEMREERISFLK